MIVARCERKRNTCFVSKGSRFEEAWWHVRYLPGIISETETKRTSSDDERRHVEYLMTPAKSVNDTKEYRLDDTMFGTHFFSFFSTSKYSFEQKHTRV